MEELGNKLRTAREEKNISLREINEKTKINTAILEAMEKGDFSVFESEVYITGALRLYAETVEMDPQEVVDLYKQLKKDHKETEEETEIKRKKRARERKKNFNNGFPPVITTSIIIIIIAVAWGLWSIFSNGIDLGINDTEENAEENDLYNDINDEDEIENDNDEEEPVEIPELAWVGEEDGNISVYELTGADEMEVLIDFIGPCWLRIHVGDEHYHEGTYGEGDESIEIVTDEEVRVHYGNPAGAEMYVNGLEIDELEDYPGEPRHIHVSLE